MQILHDPSEAAQALQNLMRHLKKDATLLTASGLENEVFWCARYRYWFSLRRTDDRQWLQFGLGDPDEGGRLESVCEMSFPLDGAGRRMDGLFLPFGKDVLLAYGCPSGGEGMSLAQFLSLHEYDFAEMDVLHPDGETHNALVISSVGGDNLSCNVARFVSALNDFRQWSAQGLLPGALPRIDFGPEARLHAEPGDKAISHLLGLVTTGLREQLGKYAEARKLPYKLGFSAQGELVLADADDSVLAVFHVQTDLAPRNLHAAVGQLILSRQALRAARFLMLPGSLGAYFSQTLFRHDIHVVTYKLTQDMAVVLDVEALFDIIRAVD